MPRNDLVDRLVLEEFSLFEEDPLGYTADRDRALGRLIDDSVVGKEAVEAWTAFERRFLTTGNGGTTLSAHGIDRARSLGEDVAVDGEVQTKIHKALRAADGSETGDRLREAVGASDREFEQNVWILRSRGVVETHTDLYGGEQSVVLTDSASEKN
jgi:hypothetical protein